MDLDRYIEGEFDAHEACARTTRTVVAETFGRLVRLASASLRDGGKILFFGNGGSAADAQHLAAELTVRYRRDRRPLPAIALGADGVALTAAANDLGFEAVFARQIAALGRPGDLAVGLSTSGRSANVIAGLKAAHESGLRTAALTGRDGGALPGLADVVIGVPSKDTARIQEMHMLIGHALCGALELEIVGAAPAPSDRRPR